MGTCTHQFCNLPTASLQGVQHVRLTKLHVSSRLCDFPCPFLLGEPSTEGQPNQGLGVTLLQTFLQRLGLNFVVTSLLSLRSNILSKQHKNIHKNLFLKINYGSSSPHGHLRNHHTKLIEKIEFWIFISTQAIISPSPLLKKTLKMKQLGLKLSSRIKIKNGPSRKPSKERYFNVRTRKC